MGNVIRLLLVLIVAAPAASQATVSRSANDGQPGFDISIDYDGTVYTASGVRLFDFSAAFWVKQSGGSTWERVVVDFVRVDDWVRADFTGWAVGSAWYHLGAGTSSLANGAAQPTYDTGVYSPASLAVETGGASVALLTFGDWRSLAGTDGEDDGDGGDDGGDDDPVDFELPEIYDPNYGSPSGSGGAILGEIPLSFPDFGHGALIQPRVIPLDTSWYVGSSVKGVLDAAMLGFAAFSAIKMSLDEMRKGG